MALEHHAQLDLDSWTLIPHPFNFMEKTYFQITANKKLRITRSLCKTNRFCGYNNHQHLNVEV